eukprot:39437-Hanusia_phi.AAC.3
MEQYLRTAVEQGVGKLLVRRKVEDGKEHAKSKLLIGRLNQLATSDLCFVRESVALVLRQVLVLDRVKEVVRLLSKGDLKERTYIADECEIIKILANDHSEKVRYAALDAVAPV